MVAAAVSGHDREPQAAVLHVRAQNQQAPRLKRLQLSTSHPDFSLALFLLRRRFASSHPTRPLLVIAALHGRQPELELELGERPGLELERRQWRGGSGCGDAAAGEGQEDPREERGERMPQCSRSLTVTRTVAA
eukprot:1434000-Rhodomonas_salina.1